MNASHTTKRDNKINKLSQLFASNEFFFEAVSFTIVDGIGRNEVLEEAKSTFLSERFHLQHETIRCEATGADSINM